MIDLVVNGKRQRLDADPQRSLLSVLREDLDLTGSKYGCGEGQCGACTVLLEGQPTRSCLIKVGSVAGKSVTTIEGLDPKGMHPVQVAWRDLSVPQCGYCQAGQIMQAAALLAKTPAPSDKQIDEAMSGNICRCGCYQRIHAAVRAASKGA